MTSEVQLSKYQVSTDMFNNKTEAESRATDMGLGQTSHTHEVDGQTYYMPASSHEVYMSHESVMKNTTQVKADIIKVDVDERLVWGWAYVSTVKGVVSVDHSQESVSPEVLVKAATNFMLSVRTAKAMHQGDSVGEVVHSFPLTNELGKSLGVSSDREGWIICMKIHDDKVWQSVKSGELSAFSIGGRALRRSLE